MREEVIGKWRRWRLVDTSSVIGQQVEARQSKVGVYMIFQLFDREMALYKELSSALTPLLLL
jgi:hypothetical protein